MDTEPRQDLPRPDLLRAAIGRFYFAAFLAARNHIEATTLEPVTRDASVHGWVPRQFSGADALHQRVRHLLLDLRETRNGADYGEAMDEEALAKSARRKSALVLSALKTLTARVR